MDVKYILISGNKKEARKNFILGMFYTWTEDNLKNAFSFGKGTIEDFRRFAIDNAGNSTHIDVNSLTYIDNGKKCDIDRKTINDVFSLWR